LTTRTVRAGHDSSRLYFARVVCLDEESHTNVPASRSLVKQRRNLDEPDWYGSGNAMVQDPKPLTREEQEVGAADKRVTDREPMEVTG
jgi:hypothetical protein